MNYSIFSFITNTNESVAIGIAIWDDDDWFDYQFVSECPALTERQFSLVKFVETKIDGWVENGLPFQKYLKPAESAWWDCASCLLIHSIKLSKPMKLSC